MAKKLNIEVGLPTIAEGSAESIEVEITRNPPGDFQKSENITVDGGTESIEVKANPGIALTVSVRAIDEKRQASNTVVRKIQVGQPMPPVLADDITAQIAEPEKQD